jgi:hypothetical protein
MLQIALPRSDFRRANPDWGQWNRQRQTLKKSAAVLNVRSTCCDLSMWERLTPPHRLYSARAPIHPKRPYGLTRPVVPPDGSFLFCNLFGPNSRRRNAAPQAADQTRSRILLCVRSEAMARHRCITAMPVRDLTVDSANNPVFVRLSCTG